MITQKDFPSFLICFIAFWALNWRWSETINRRTNTLNDRSSESGVLTTHLEPASSVLVEHISLWAAKMYLDFRDFEILSADSLEYCPRSSSNWHGYCSSSLAQGDHKSSFNCRHQEADDRYRHKSRGRGVSRLNYIEPFHHCDLQLYACTQSLIRWRLGYWRG